MKKLSLIRSIIVLLVLITLFPVQSDALMIKNPDEIKVQGLVSFGEDGAAWLNW